MVKLNLGCGNVKLEGFINLDIDAKCKPDVLCDVLKGLPYENESIEYVHAKHFGEHFTPDELLFIFKECYRVLKHNGTLEMSVDQGATLEVLKAKDKTPKYRYEKGSFQSCLTRAVFQTSG